MRRDLRIVFAGGGTGGHVFPAIYMAEYLSKQWGADCQFIGTKKGLENRKVSQAGFLVRHIWISGFKRGLYLSNPHLIKFNMPNISKQMSKDLKEKVTTICLNSLPLIQIFKIKESALNHSLAKSVLKSYSVNNGFIDFIFGFD